MSDVNISLRTKLIVSFLAVVIVTGFVATLVGVNLLQKLSMPANYRGDIIFISDSQGFYKEGKAPEECLNAMIDEFTGYWAPIFYPNPVGFQIGYDSDWSNDKLWWSKLPQPYPKYVGEAIFLKIPKDQECSIFWVDFTLREVLLDK